MWITTDTVTSLAFMILCSVSDSVLNAINLTIYVKWRRVYSPRQTILKLLTIVDLFISIVIIPCSIVAQLFSLPDEVRLFLSFITSDSSLCPVCCFQSLLHNAVLRCIFQPVSRPMPILMFLCVSSACSPSLLYQESAAKKSGLSGLECVSLTVFLGGVILIMC